MVAMNSGPYIGMADLPSSLVNRSMEKRVMAGESVPPAAAIAYPSPFASPLSTEGAGILTLAEVEKRAILQAMEYTKGDRTVAAAMLGIGRTTLYRKLKEYDL